MTGTALMLDRDCTLNNTVACVNKRVIPSSHSRLMTDDSPANEWPMTVRFCAFPR